MILWNIWSKSLSSEPGSSYIDSLRLSHPLTFLTSCLTLILLMWRIWWAPNNASRWQMGFNSAFKGLMLILCFVLHCHVEFCNVLAFYGWELVALWTAPKLEKHSLSTVINRRNWITGWKDCRDLETLKERCSPSDSALQSFHEVHKVVFLLS